MSGTRIGCPALAIGLGALLGAVAACAEVDVAPTEPLAASQAAEQVAALAAVRALSTTATTAGCRAPSSSPRP